MQFFVKTLCSALAGLLLSGSLLHAGWLWDRQYLVAIDEQKYTTEDFRRWWENWQEEDSVLPETAEPFIDWHLLFNEAEKMELYLEPSYRKKVSVFLKARTLLLLKNEAVDSRIDISEEELQARYQTEYVPQRQVQVLYFNDQESADRAYQDLQSATLTLEDFREAARQPDPQVYVQEKWLRPRQTESAWESILRELPEQQFRKPFAWEKGYVLLHLKQYRGPTPEDYQNQREFIRRELWKERQAALTVALVEELKEKYQIKVNEQLFEALEPQDLPEELAEQPLITTNRGTLSAEQFLHQIRQEQAFRTDYGFQEESFAQLKRRVLNGMVAQTVTTWEALARHYENQEPFKGVYRFYCQHRLIKELEKRLFLPQTDPSAEEIKGYYQEHLSEFTEPAIITLARLETTSEEAGKIWTRIALGDDFQKTAKRISPHGAPVQKLPWDHLEPEIQQIVNTLAPNEVSSPFLLDGKTLLIHLVDRKPARPVPLAQVENIIRQQVRGEKLARIRDAYLAQLKEKTEISVNQDRWNTLRQELNNADATTP